MQGEPHLRTVSETPYLLLVLGGELRNEMPFEQRQILFALRQPWNLNLHHREPVIKILAKALFGDCGAEIVIGGRNDADVHLARRERTHALHFLVLQHSQKFGLGGERHIADFVEEQRAPIGVLGTNPALSLVAPVNEPLTWPKSSLSNRVSTTAEQFSTT